MKKIGLYGGTFDPIHNAHIALALELKEIHHLDEVWFSPANINPHKIDDVPPTAVKHRVEMVKLAIAPIEGFYLYDYEANKKGPSFTVDSIKNMVATNEEKNSYYLLLSDEIAENFSTWHDAEGILSLVKLLVGRRRLTSLDIEALAANKDIKQAILKGMTQTTILEISSTNIRERIRNGQYCGHLTPQKVVDYINQNCLYS